jgi:single-strand DNA-binding protein
MAKSINTVVLMGRLTRDPELRTTTSGKSIASFSLAVDRYGSSEETDFFDVTAWDKLAEIVDKFIEKGSKVLVQGRLQHDRWEKDGEKRSRVTVTATDVTFLDSVSPDDGTKKDVVPTDIDDKPIDLSDIPF